MTNHTNLCKLVTAAAVLLLVGAAPRTGWSGGYSFHDEDGEEIAFEVAEVFFELNDTDGDLGLHALVDGEPWRHLAIQDTRERRMLDVRVRGRLGRQGLTELFFESAEPDFDALAPEDFFRRFPAGIYEVEGRTLEGQEMGSETELTHVLPAPPEFTVNGEPAEPPEGEECDEEEPTPIGSPVVVEWDAVTGSHPELGADDPDIEILRYQVVAEWEDEDENVFTTSLDVQPEEGAGSYSVMLPEEFFVDGSEVKFEVLVREASFNQTAVESCPFEFVAEP